MSLSATIALEEAADRLWDVAVIGAGPAGASAAREIARRGASVLLIDRSSFPRYKVCGCCLSHGAVQSLREAGLGSRLTEDLAVPLRRLRLAAGGRRAEIPLPRGAAISREVLDCALVEAAIDAGAAFLSECEARLGTAGPDCRSLRLGKRDGWIVANARVVLGATGLAASPGGAETELAPIIGRNSRIGAGAIAELGGAGYRPGTIDMACGRGGYVGLVRLEDGRLNLAAAFDRAYVRRAGGLGAAAERILNEAGLPPIDGIARLNWRGTPPLTRRPRSIASHRFLALGDAAGYVEPFTGDGMAQALASASAIAPLAAEGAKRWDARIERAWLRRRRSAFARRDRITFLLGGVLRRPWTAGLATRMLEGWPRIGASLVAAFNPSPMHAKASVPRRGVQE